MSASHFSKLAKSESSDGYSTHAFIQAALLFRAFQIEALVNAIGERKNILDSWEASPRSTIEEKLSCLCKLLDIENDNGSAPFQSIYELIKYRNYLAHTKTTMISKTIDSSEKTKNKKYKWSTPNLITLLSKIEEHIEDIETQFTEGQPIPFARASIKFDASK